MSINIVVNEMDDLTETTTPLKRGRKPANGLQAKTTAERIRDHRYALEERIEAADELTERECLYVLSRPKQYPPDKAFSLIALKQLARLRGLIVSETI